MPEDQPGKRAPQMPPDPFSAAHMGHIAILEMYRGLRRTGGGMIEAAVIVGGILAVMGEAGQNKGNGNA